MNLNKIYELLQHGHFKKTLKVFKKELKKNKNIETITSDVKIKLTKDKNKKKKFLLGRNVVTNDNTNDSSELLKSSKVTPSEGNNVITDGCDHVCSNAVLGNDLTYTSFSTTSAEKALSTHHELNSKNNSSILEKINIEQNDQTLNEMHDNIIKRTDESRSRKRKKNSNNSDSFELPSVNSVDTIPENTTVISSEVTQKKKRRTSFEPTVRRIDSEAIFDQIKGSRFADFTFKSKQNDQYASKAAEDFKNIRGKDFKREMQKKKRSSWKGSVNYRYNYLDSSYGPSWLPSKFLLPYENEINLSPFRYAYNGTGVYEKYVPYKQVLPASDMNFELPVPFKYLKPQNVFVDPYKSGIPNQFPYILPPFQYNDNINFDWLSKNSVYQPGNFIQDRFNTKTNPINPYRSIPKLDLSNNAGHYSDNEYKQYNDTPKDLSQYQYQKNNGINNNRLPNSYNNFRPNYSNNTALLAKTQFGSLEDIFNNNENQQYELSKKNDHVSNNIYQGSKLDATGPHLNGNFFHNENSSNFNNSFNSDYHDNKDHINNTKNEKTKSLSQAFDFQKDDFNQSLEPRSSNNDEEPTKNYKYSYNISSEDEAVTNYSHVPKEHNRSHIVEKEYNRQPGIIDIAEKNHSCKLYQEIQESIFDHIKNSMSTCIPENSDFRSQYFYNSSNPTQSSDFNNHNDSRKKKGFDLYHTKSINNQLFPKRESLNPEIIFERQIYDNQNGKNSIQYPRVTYSSLNDKNTQITKKTDTTKPFKEFLSISNEYYETSHSYTVSNENLLDSTVSLIQDDIDCQSLKFSNERDSDDLSLYTNVYIPQDKNEKLNMDTCNNTAEVSYKYQKNKGRYNNICLKKKKKNKINLMKRHGDLLYLNLKRNLKSNPLKKKYTKKKPSNYKTNKIKDYYSHISNSKDFSSDSDSVSYSEERQKYYKYFPQKYIEAISRNLYESNKPKKHISRRLKKIIERILLYDLEEKKSRKESKKSEIEDNLRLKRKYMPFDSLPKLYECKKLPDCFKECKLNILSNITNLTFENEPIFTLYEHREESSTETSEVIGTCFNCDFDTLNSSQQGVKCFHIKSCEPGETLRDLEPQNNRCNSCKHKSIKENNDYHKANNVMKTLNCLDDEETQPCKSERLKLHHPNDASCFHHHSNANNFKLHEYEMKNGSKAVLNQCNDVCCDHCNNGENNSTEIQDVRDSPYTLNLSANKPLRNSIRFHDQSNNCPHCKANKIQVSSRITNNLNYDSNQKLLEESHNQVFDNVKNSDAKNIYQKSIMKKDTSPVRVINESNRDMLYQNKCKHSIEPLEQKNYNTDENTTVLNSSTNNMPHQCKCSAKIAELPNYGKIYCDSSGEATPDLINDEKYCKYNGITESPISNFNHLGCLSNKKCSNLLNNNSVSVNEKKDSLNGTRSINNVFRSLPKKTSMLPNNDERLQDIEINCDLYCNISENDRLTQVPGESALDHNQYTTNIENRKKPSEQNYCYRCYRDNTSPEVNITSRNNIKQSLPKSHNRTIHMPISNLNNSKMIDESYIRENNNMKLNESNSTSDNSLIEKDCRDSNVVRSFYKTTQSFRNRRTTTTSKDSETKPWHITLRNDTNKSLKGQVKKKNSNQLDENVMTSCPCKKICEYDRKPKNSQLELPVSQSVNIHQANRLNQIKSELNRNISLSTVALNAMDKEPVSLNHMSKSKVYQSMNTHRIDNQLTHRLVQNSISDNRDLTTYPHIIGKSGGNCFKIDNSAHNYTQTHTNRCLNKYENDQLNSSFNTKLSLSDAYNLNSQKNHDNPSTKSQKPYFYTNQKADGELLLENIAYESPKLSCYKSSKLPCGQLLNSKYSRHEYYDSDNQSNDCFTEQSPNLLIETGHVPYESNSIDQYQQTPQMNEVKLPVKLSSGSNKSKPQLTSFDQNQAVKLTEKLYGQCSVKVYEIHFPDKKGFKKKSKRMGVFKSKNTNSYYENGSIMENQNNQFHKPCTVSTYFKNFFGLSKPVSNAAYVNV